MTDSICPIAGAMTCISLHIIPHYVLYVRRRHQQYLAPCWMLNHIQSILKHKTDEWWYNYHRCYGNDHALNLCIACCMHVLLMYQIGHLRTACKHTSVSKTRQTCFFHLRRLRLVRRLLGRDVTANPGRRICALTTRLLQRSARRAAVRDHSATATSHQRRCQTGLRSASARYWLSIEYKIQYKICLLVTVPSVPQSQGSNTVQGGPN